METQQTLEDLCLLIVDCEHKTAPVSDEGYPSIRTPNVGRGMLLLDGVNRVDEPTYRAWTKRAVPQEDDLIIAREAPLENVAIIPRGVRVCLGQRTVLVRPDPTKVDPRFLCYFLLGNYAQERFQAAATGATVPHLNMRDIRGLPIPLLPSIKVQHRIGAILGAYDDLIAVNRRRIAVLEEMARSLFEEWFEHAQFPTQKGSRSRDRHHGVAGDLIDFDPGPRFEGSSLLCPWQAWIRAHPSSATSNKERQVLEPSLETVTHSSLASRLALKTGRLD